MKARERVLRVLEHREDRVPIDLGGTQNSTLCAGAYANFKRFLGVEAPTRKLSRVFETVIMDEAVLRRLPVDTRPRAVRETIRAMHGLDGGYVLAAVHNVQDDVPPENVWAMLEEASRAGRGG